MLRCVRLFALILCGAALASCILMAEKDAGADSGREPPQTPAQTPIAGARAAGGWQEKAVALFKDNAALTDVYGLFSEGGWSDVGQIIVAVPGTTTPAQVLTVRANIKDKIEATQAVPAAGWDAFKAATVKAEVLADVDVVAFDALTYEYVHFQRQSDGRVKDVKRVFVRNPGSRPMPEHDALIKAFETLSTSFAGR